MDWRRQGSLR